MNLPHLLLALAALALAVSFALVPLLRWRLDHDAFVRSLVRLVEHDNLDRAGKLCRAGRPALICVMAEAVLARAAEGTGTLADLAPTMRRALEAAEARLARHTRLALGALVLAGASAALGADGGGDGPPVGWILDAAVVPVLLGGAWAVHRVRRSARLLPVDLLTPLVARRIGEAPVPQAVVEAVLSASSPVGPDRN